MAIVQLKELQHTDGSWTAVYQDKFLPNVDNWVLPARAYGISLDEFVKFVMDNFHPNKVTFTTYLSFSWNKQADERKYKNAINAQLRKAGIEL